MRAKYYRESQRRGEKKRETQTQVACNTRSTVSSLLLDVSFLSLDISFFISSFPDVSGMTVTHVDR